MDYINERWLVFDIFMILILINFLKDDDEFEEVIM